MFSKTVMVCLLSISLSSAVFADASCCKPKKSSSGIKGFVFASCKASDSADWQAKDGVLFAPATDDMKLFSKDGVLSDDCVVGFEVHFADRTTGQVGIIFKATSAAGDANGLSAYELRLDPNNGKIFFGKYQNGWHQIKEATCPIEFNRWTTVEFKLKANHIRILYNGNTYVDFTDDSAPVAGKLIGFRTSHRSASFKGLSVLAAGKVNWVPFESEAAK